MKPFFLSIFVLLIVLGSVSALKIGETKVVNIDGADNAITYNGVKDDDTLDLSKTIYLGINKDVGVGETTQLTDAATGECLYYVTGKSFSEDMVEVVVSKCESTIEGIGEGDIELIYPEPTNPNFCFSVEHKGTDASGNPILKVDVPEICEPLLPPEQGAQEPFFIEVDGQCFSATVIQTEPEVKIKVDVADAAKCQKACPLPENEQETTYNIVDDVCFSTTTLCLNPLQLKVDSADYSVCKLWEAQKDCTTKVETPEPEYILVDNQCFETTSICTNPVKVYVDAALSDKCVITTSTEVTGSESPKGDGDGDGDDDGGDDTAPGLGGGGGGGGSMSGVPLNIPKSLPLYNEGYCKNQLHKQKCADGYRTYKCGPYNVNNKAAYKDFKEECASCNNNQQDHNEDGIDCGGICPNKCLVTEEGKGTITQPFGKTEGVPILTEPSAFEKYRISLIILIAIIGLIVGMVLWIHKPKQEGYTISATQQPQQSKEQIKEKEAIPDRLKGIPKDEIDSMKKYIKTQLGKGVDRQKITNMLENVGWKKEIIDYIFDEMQHHVLPTQYEEQLRRYIGYYIHKGVAQDKIKATLLKSGWQEEVINKILVDLK